MLGTKEASRLDTFSAALISRQQCLDLELWFLHIRKMCLHSTAYALRKPIEGFLVAMHLHFDCYLVVFPML